MSTLIHTAVGSVAVREQGSGPAIVLCHGNSCSSRAFAKQFEGALTERFRLIAIDLPGHGDSPPAASPDTTYTLGGHAEALVAAVSELQATDAVFVGWSLGGHVILEASVRLPQAAGYFMAGVPPVASLADFMTALFDEPGLQVAFREESTDEEVRSLITLFVRQGGTVPEFSFDDFRRTDKRARGVLAASAARDELRDEVRIVAELAKPLAVVYGVDEAVVRRDYFDRIPMPTLWRGAVQEIPNAGHTPHWENPDVFDRLLADFARDCAKNA